MNRRGIILAGGSGTRLHPVILGRGDAWRSGWINDAQLTRLAEACRKSGYGEYLLSIMQDRVS